ncbi:MAG: tetratricopeptide repeat protein [Betaproteobacteria bacterium HGW-Betaproteobacteria-22]|nr:MAG: tetratricopeptide repeat protein [Betaproteobacteria bacterium HGW-Betaproteobacteria-22]
MSILKKKPTSVPKHTYWLLILSTTIFLNACASQQRLKQDAATASSVLAEQHTTPAEKTLDPEFIFKYLVGEIAGQRGETGTSGAIFYELAKSEQDARLAERAAKIAAYANISNLAIPAIRLWAELAPDSIEAQQAMTEMLIATGSLEQAEPHLAKLLTKEDTRASGFLYLNSLFNRSADKLAILKLIESLAKPYPDLAEAQFAIAQAAYNANQDATAIKAIENTEALQPHWSIAALLKGQILFKKSPQAAIAFYESYLKAKPENNEVRINLAKVLVSQKQFAAAKTHYPIILDIAGKNSADNLADLNAIIGLLSYQAEDYIAAENYFKQALALDFKDADQIYIYLAQVAEKQQHDVAAMNWYNKVSNGPRYLEAQFSLANLVARKQSADSAIALLDALENLTTEQQILVIQSQASILAKAKRHTESFDLLEKTVNNLPNTPDLVYDYALAAERVGKFDLMESELRRAIAEKPDFAAAYNALGYSFADRNIKLNEAVKLIEKALALSPNDHYMLDSLGWAYYRKGDLNKALKYLQQAYDINPDPEIAAHLGEVLWHKGEHDKAKKIWSDALIKNPDNDVLIITTNKFRS